MGDNRINVPSQVKLSIELLESDFLPFSFTEVVGSRQVTQGVEKDAWGRPTAYYIYKTHPGDMYALPAVTDLKRVSASRILHLKLCKRIRQTRGVTIFHGILNRLDDIKDYEEAERVAARVAAATTAMITKSSDFATPSTVDGQRTMEMNPGMIYDNLLPGENVEIIDSNRPNTELSNFRNAMMRAVAAGTGSNYSSISKDYNGTYSAQRQEMVESQPAYDRMRNFFIEHFLNPIYRQFIEVARMQGLLVIPASVDEQTLLRPSWSRPAVSWVDPKKEVEAEVLAIENGLTTRTEIIRRHGGDPEQVLAQREIEKEIEDKINPAPRETSNTASGSPGDPPDENEENAA
jgi:lambda family phage portal protein